MERKSFQIVMDPSAHRRAKIRSGQLGCTIGQYLENLISAMEIRLERAYKNFHAQNMQGLIDDRFLNVLLKADQKGLSEATLKNELQQTVIDANSENLNFNPKITLNL